MFLPPEPSTSCLIRILPEVHRGRLSALFDEDCIFVVGRGAKFHGAEIRYGVVGELGLAASAQVHGAAGGKRHEVRAVVAEDRAFVGAVGRGLQLPSASPAPVAVT